MNTLEEKATIFAETYGHKFSFNKIIEGGMIQFQCELCGKMFTTDKRMLTSASAVAAFDGTYILEGELTDINSVPKRFLTDFLCANYKVLL